jgi:hypothetical protein
MFEMVLGRVCRVLGRVHLVCVRELSVVCGLTVIPGLMMLCRLGMVMGRHAGMMGGVAMFVHCLL